ncbi:MAG: histidine kinase [Oliverpabstia sp.]|nr:histidine kinase [Lachnospiraceae bacterium]MDY5027926.1 histidine kinase [Oliverpabstia sp.]
MKRIERCIHELKLKFNNMGIARKIMFLLFVVSLIPLFCTMIVYYNLSSRVVRSQTTELILANLEQSANNVQNFWQTYEDIIQSIYIDDFYGEEMQPINVWDSNNYQFSKSEITKRLENIVYTNKEILGILIVGQYYDICFYDSVTSSSQTSFCFDTETKYLRTNVYIKEAMEEDKIVYSSLEHISSLEFGSKDVLYIACQLRNFESFDEEPMGCVMLCVDESALEDVYGKSNTNSNITMVTNEFGDILSFPSASLAGVNILEESVGVKSEKDEKTGEEVRIPADQEEIENAATVFLQQRGYLEGSRLEAVSKEVRKGTCYVINVQNSDYAMRNFSFIVDIMVIFTLLVGIFCVILSIDFSRNVDDSVQPIISAMEEADRGNLHAKIEIRGNNEFSRIARQFNKMIVQIRVSGEQEREALLREKNAEIKSLEAQINPHFLYNTLDAINWVALDRQEYTISRMLTSLATILRYSIHKSNEEVELRDELEYLRKYVYLQQQRFDYSFVCVINADESILSYRVHKLLIQPLLENTIVHGFPGNTGMDEINIQISEIGNGKMIQIVVEDNGVGMEQEKVDFFNHFDYQNEKIESSIGVRNVITRLKLYYGEEGKFYMTSGKDGTRITIRIPYDK